MARADPQINLRISADLKARIEAEAKRNKRSMNAELTARLERSFEILPADETVDMSALPPEALEEAARRAMEMIIDRRPDIFGENAKRKK